MRTPSFALVSLALALLACGGSTPEPVTPPTADADTPKTSGATTTEKPADPPPAPAAKPAFDPVALGMTPDGARKLCDEHLAKAKGLAEDIKALKGAPADKLTFASTVGRFDDVVLEVASAGEFPYLMGVAHPDAAVREAAKACEPKTDAFQTSLWLDADVAAVIQAYAKKGEKLEGERARLLADVLRDFRRNGLELSADKQARLRELNAEITKKGQAFMSNIGASTEWIEVDEKELEGLPKEYVASHKPNDKKKVRISTDYPDYFPFITYAKNRKLALELYVKFTNRGGKQNVRLLEELLALRTEKAKLLGYETWADYAIEPRMAKSRKNVREFLDNLSAALKDPVKVELEELRKEHVRLGGKKTDVLYPADRYYLEDKVRKAKYNFDSQALAEYFEIGAVKKGLMDTTAKMYGLEYREVPAAAWHPDVTAYEVWSKGEKIGKFYLDLYARADKYKHAAMFGVRTAKRLPDGTWQQPMAALVCNFPKSEGSQPGLMSHEEVTTFFHEFGHVLHQLLTRSELASYSGSNAVRDFVEAPSQMFEEWAWSRDVLDTFARHYKTGEKIPDALFTSMTKARTFGLALGTQRQLFLASLDQELHARKAPFDTTKVVEEVQGKVDVFPYVKGTHFQSSFGHLIGYDAGYYGYQWALSLSRDVLTRFRKEGLLNTTTADAWRTEVLAKGGGEDERTMISRFLGRAPSHDAYFTYLKGKE
ncbi:M3 family metallopeptidase [Polyangium fumosum]|uniref:Oligopeptidase A n=1 Tax=Polyangium fumosum TaxID=889272 RepID=A0A4U1JAT5_9BACT|nr:M3 family metallopeptidase [Polyangium fumosum]TKD06252.1 oligopeptidase A [Polyangium fumosum]